MNERRTHALLAAAVAAATLVVFLPALRNGFVNWDDDVYVYANRNLRALDLSFLSWAFHSYQRTWHPLTWFSHALDIALWGADPRGHHLTSIVLHAANAAAVALLALRLSAAAQGPFSSGRPLLIAAGASGLLFGIHPLHVEPAVWVSARKDLLCTLFYLLSLLAYARHARAGAADAPAQGRRGAYYASLAFFLLALLSKIMAVTLPLVLLIFDAYPFRRVRSFRGFLPLLREKLPFFALSGSVAVLAVLANSPDATFTAIVPLPVRSLVAVQAVLVYLGRMLLPLHLVPVYPYPAAASALAPAYLVPLLLVPSITAACIAVSRKQPLWLAVWGFYIVTLLPVLGFVQIAGHAMADRYAYLPSISPVLLAGLFCAWLWERADGVRQRFPRLRPALAVAAAALCVVLAAASVRQTAVWKDSISLWTAEIEQEPRRVPAAYHNRGNAFREAGLPDRAIEDLTTAMALERPTSNTANSRGLAYLAAGRPEEALRDFDRAIALDPGYADAFTNRGWTYREMGRLDRAMADLDRATALDPASAAAYNNRGMVLMDRNRIGNAVDDFTRAVSVDPAFASAWVNRGLAFARISEPGRSIEDFTSAIAADPSFAAAYTNRGLLYQQEGRLEQALADLDRAIKLDPGSAEAYMDRGLVFEDQGRFDRALGDYDHAIELRPDDPAGYNDRGIALMGLRRFDEAAHAHTRALELDPEFGRAYLDRGTCYRELGMTGRAMQDFRSACRRGIEEGCAAANGAALPLPRNGAR